MAPQNISITLRYAPIRSPHQPLAWIGMDKADRLLADDVTVFGLRRMVIARKGMAPDVDDYVETVQKRYPNEEIYFCLTDLERDDGFMYLWIFWKEKAKC